MDVCNIIRSYPRGGTMFEANICSPFLGVTESSANTHTYTHTVNQKHVKFLSLWTVTRKNYAVFIGF